MISIGMMIQNRYEILDKIGTGGMSDVYKAIDNKLNRYVAIKVLKQEFAENRSFVSKFIVEAQAAAGLMHHNIVNVYDVGEENGIHYIVMELVEGITLKNYIEKKVRLTSKEAISIAIQVALGIEAAHNNHIIHRDIKPQNIIISKDGKVKVTDFGIAKAATSNTITSNAMGSVHYTSPEQARGGFSDEKSDIYSLGITLFEMLTGRVPFNGDTTVAIAIKHIQDEMPSPRNFVPDIPVSVEQIIMKCTQKNPDRRYQNMSEIIADLKHSLIAPDEAFVKIDNVEEAQKTRIVTNREQIKREMVPDKPLEKKPQIKEPIRRIPEDKDMVQKQNTKKKPASKKTSSMKTSTMKTSERKERKEEFEDNFEEGFVEKRAAANRNPVKKPRREEPLDEFEDKKYGKDYGYNPKADKILTGITVALAIVIGCLLLYFAGTAIGLFDKSPISVSEDKTNENQESVSLSTSENGMKVPGLIGSSEAEATSALKNNGLKVEKVYEYSNQYAKGIVIGQSIDADAKVPLETVITITISRGAEDKNVIMPNILGKTQEEMKEILDAEGIALGTVEETYSTEYPEGQICYQGFEAGAEIAAGTRVDVKISIGLEAAGVYSCNIVIQTPTNYAGGNAEVILMSGDGTEQLWYSSNVNSFPLTINKTNFTCSSNYGVVYVTYIKNVETTVTGEDGNTTTQIVQTTDQIQQSVKFTMQ